MTTIAGSAFHPLVGFLHDGAELLTLERRPTIG